MYSLKHGNKTCFFFLKLALRAGNEKVDESADTVGCCSLRVEHIKLHEELNGKQYVVVFDFLGKKICNNIRIILLLDVIISLR